MPTLGAAVFQLAVADFLAEALAGALVQLLVRVGHGVASNALAADANAKTQAGAATPVFGRDLDGRDERIQDNILYGLGGLGFHLFLAAVAQAAHGLLGQVAHHAFHVAAHVADFGKLAGLDFHEGRVGQDGEAARNLGFADARGPNHEDIVGHNLLLHVGRGVQTAPAVAQRNGHVALGLVLANDVLIEFGHNLGRGKKGGI